MSAVRSRSAMLRIFCFAVLVSFGGDCSHGNMWSVWGIVVSCQLKRWCIHCRPQGQECPCTAHAPTSSIGPDCFASLQHVETMCTSTPMSLRMSCLSQVQSEHMVLRKSMYKSAQLRVHIHTHIFAQELRPKPKTSTKSRPTAPVISRFSTRLIAPQRPRPW